MIYEFKYTLSVRVVRACKLGLSNTLFKILKIFQTPNGNQMGRPNGANSHQRNYSQDLL